MPCLSEQPKNSATRGRPPPPCQSRSSMCTLIRMSIGTKARGLNAQSTSGSTKIARMMEKTCIEPMPRLAVSRCGSRPTASARAWQRSLGAPVNSSWSRSDGAVVPMPTEPTGNMLTLRPLGTDTPSASSGNSWPIASVGWMTCEISPRKLRNTRSLPRETCTMQPRGMVQARSLSSAKVEPTLCSIGLTKHIPCAIVMPCAQTFCSRLFDEPCRSRLALHRLPILAAHLRASLRCERWST
mmetsp:Transcript_95866/g.275240  ORF Transcript_95866/g.275240 Transcript_95866/m.275240 type:complete len:241 (+) Transcript_95866:348-1070(+)